MMTVWKMNGNRSIIVAVLNVPMLKDLILKCGSPVAPRPFHALISRLAGWLQARTAAFYYTCYLSPKNLKFWGQPCPDSLKKPLVSAKNSNSSIQDFHLTDTEEESPSGTNFSGPLESIPDNYQSDSQKNTRYKIKSKQW